MEYAAKVVAPALKIAPKDLRVAVVAEDTAFGIQMMDAAVAKAKEYGVQIVLREHYSAARTTDMSPIILKLRSTAPDVIVATSFINDAILFARQSKELKYAPKAFIGTSAGHSTTALAKAIGDDTAGLFSSSYPPDINPDGLAGGARKDLEEFKRRYQAKYSQVPAVQEVVGFVTGMILFHDVLPKAAGLEPDQIRAAAKALDVPVGSHINGWGVKFDEKGQNMRSFATVVQWQGQQMKVVYPPSLAVASPIMLPLPAWDQR